jgi:hypothetical protein
VFVAFAYRWKCSPTAVIDVNDIDFTMSILDHLDDQFADYGFVDPGVSIGGPSDEESDATFQSIGVLRDNAVALAQAIENTSSFARALHSFEAQILSLRTTCVVHYQHLRQVDAIIGSKTSICAHLDGGAMTSTTGLGVRGICSNLFGMSPMSSGVPLSFRR